MLHGTQVIEAEGLGEAADVYVAFPSALIGSSILEILEHHQHAYLHDFLPDS